MRPVVHRAIIRLGIRSDQAQRIGIDLDAKARAIGCVHLPFVEGDGVLLKIREWPCLVVVLEHDREGEWCKRVRLVATYTEANNRPMYYRPDGSPITW